MASNLERVQDGFPPGVRVPDAVATLCEYLDLYGYPLSGSFEISHNGMMDAESWFSDVEARRQIGIFGRGSTGSSYAIWLTNSPDADEAPVVVLGSEGEFLALATSPLEFCRLLGCGYDELEWADFAGAPKYWEETDRLRQWLKTKLGLDISQTGKETVTAAAGAQEAFRRWMAENGPG